MVRPTLALFSAQLKKVIVSSSSKRQSFGGYPSHYSSNGGGGGGWGAQSATWGGGGGADKMGNLGVGLKNVDWASQRLEKFEKNFYVEDKRVSSRSDAEIDAFRRAKEMRVSIPFHSAFGRANSDWPRFKEEVYPVPLRALMKSDSPVI